MQATHFSGSNAPPIAESTARKPALSTNETFSYNFRGQLDDIRAVLERAIANLGSYVPEQWWMSLPEIRQAACKAQLQALKSPFHQKIAFAGSENPCLNDLCKDLGVEPCSVDGLDQDKCDLLIAPHTLYTQFEQLFKASEELLRSDTLENLQAHPFFGYFERLNTNGQFIATLNSGPNIHDLTSILLEKHELELEKANQVNLPSLKIFKNIETFFRCLDIFTRCYERRTGKVIVRTLSFSLPKIPLEAFCEGYVRHHPELATMTPQALESFVRLLSVFTIANSIVDCNITVAMSVQENGVLLQQKRSFKPIIKDPCTFMQRSQASQTNEISVGQLDLTKQIQNLNGSELSMPYIKDADGHAQYEALQQLLERKTIRMVDLGGGRGETNAVTKAIQERGAELHLLNIEPYRDFAKDYIDAHHAVGVQDVQVLQKKAQELIVSDVTTHFHDEKVDLIFASHSLYFELGDMHKAALNPHAPLREHTLWKYFQMLRDDGVFLVTLQTGAGARLYRNALLADHGLHPPAAAVEDETVSLLKSFGNMATALRHIEYFVDRYKSETGRSIDIKMHYAVANVPLGGFTVSRDSESGGYCIHNPQGSDEDPDWLAPRMLDFYGNWNELQKAANTQQDTPARKLAHKTQSTFLHILRIFAPAQMNMQHPNITLKLTLLSK